MRHLAIQGTVFLVLLGVMFAFASAPFWWPHVDRREVARAREFTGRQNPQHARAGSPA